MSMKCTRCGRGTVFFGDTCGYCGTTNRDNTQALDGLWARGRSRRSQQRDYDTVPAGSGGFFSVWWPMKLLFLPLYLAWKVLRLLLGVIF